MARLVRNDLLVLGIETSCDETAAAIVRGRSEILSSAVASQTIHSQYGGVVPELASRAHIEKIEPIVQRALQDADMELSDLDGIAVTSSPGLIGSLLVGVSYAKGLAYATSLPFVGVNHIHAHLHAIFLEAKHPEYPFLGLVISGGHTNLYIVRGPCEFELLGQTRDDAVGEAFDKVGAVLGWGYPAGQKIDRMSQGVAPAIPFPRPLGNDESFDFSFSGLKTAVALYVQKKSLLSEAEKREIASSFQEACVDVLYRKVARALQKTGLKNVVVAGGVAANSRLRARFQEFPGVYFPQLQWCTDNAAMIASLGAVLLERGERSPLNLTPEAYMD